MVPTVEEVEPLTQDSHDPQWFLLISYWPGSENTKPNTHKRPFSSDNKTNLETIIPRSCMFEGLSWYIRNKVLQAQQSDPEWTQTLVHLIASMCPVWSFFFIGLVGHGFPGFGSTLGLLRWYFWWPSLYRNFKGYVLAGNACACNRTATQLPIGFLPPLAFPKRLWANIALDLVTGFLSSRG